MSSIFSITPDVQYIGVNDHDIDLFEGQYIVPNGMAYNSYAVRDSKCAVFDTVDQRFGAQWLENIKAVFGDAEPDYLIIQHMEPDHAANIPLFMDKYPHCVIVSSTQAFSMMANFFGLDFADRRLVVKGGDSLCLGKHVLHFIAAPMVHWPEVIMSYDAADNILFSADGFGKFGALDVKEDWDCEARRYYFGIVGKFGMQVQQVLKAAAKLNIKIICPTHGPVLQDNLAYYLDKYNTWSSYQPESEGVVIAFTSVYGHTKQAVELLAKLLTAKGENVVIHDLARTDMAEAVEDAFRYSKLVLATTTYNLGIFPFMRDFIEHLKERNYQNRFVGIIENGSWAPQAARIIKELFAKSKDIRFAEHTLTIKSALNDNSMAQLKLLSQEL